MTLVLTEHCGFLLRLTGYLVENIFFSVRFRSFFNVLKWSRGKSKYNKCLRWSFRPGASSRPEHAGLVHVFEMKFFSSFLDEQDLEFYVHPNHVNSLLQGFFVTGVLLPELSVGFFSPHPPSPGCCCCCCWNEFPGADGVSKELIGVTKRGPLLHRPNWFCQE